MVTINLKRIQWQIGSQCSSFMMDVMWLNCIGDELSSSILSGLEFGDVLVGVASKDANTVAETGGNERVDHRFGV